MDISLIINKLKELRNFKTDKEFADYVGITKQTLVNWKSRNSISVDLILIKYTEVNPQWLLTGEGEMLLDTSSSSNISIRETEIEHVDTEEIPCKFTLPCVDIDLILDKEADIKELVKDAKVGTRRLKDFVAPADFFQRVTSSEMAPYLLPGDVLLVRFCEDKTKFAQGEVHMVDTVCGPLLRYTYYNKEEDAFCLKPNNTDYETEFMAAEYIHSVNQIVGCIRQNINRLPQTVDVESLLKKRDSQIDALLAAHSKQNDTMAVMIAEIAEQNKRMERMFSEITKKFN